ncbi:phage terminase small subunit P27 family [Amycolatopsis sp. NPDC059657]|uniref:phage terminase small subunit P27 family n=1 Tax=Amycolatopsis sp. NPDC059657 TaxID=3346899 RepID=UPI00367156B5
MGARGKPPAPTALKILHGTKPSRINQNEPVPDTATVVPPRELDHRAQEIWDRLAPDLIRKGVLTAWDVDSFATFCTMVVVNQDATRDVEQNGTSITTLVRETHDGTCIYDLRKNPAWQVARESATLIVTLGGRFGLNPSDRSQLSLPPVEESGKGAERLLG